jgi:NAD(P)H-hydrate epimerase
MKILTAAQVREIDQECTRLGTSVSVLMENAGQAVAEETRRILKEIGNQNFVCLVGPGNNGGDGLVAARYLHDWGGNVLIYLATPRPPDDLNLRLAKDRGIPCLEAADDSNFQKIDEALASATCVIDALLGTGKLRPFSDVLQHVLVRTADEKSKRDVFIIAVDLPSGLDADTGAVDPACLYADATITLAFPKIGLFGYPGAERTGTIRIVDIGIPESLAEPVRNELLTDDWAKTVIPKRPVHANKGSFGKALVMAGSINYTGAAYLACTGAIRVGAGLVTLATASSLHPILASKLTEVTHLPLPESAPGMISPAAEEIIRPQFRQYDTLLAGCGLGQGKPVKDLLTSLLFQKDAPRLVIDADGLNILSGIPDWWRQIPDDAILTPHPGELSRMSGLSIAEIQAKRLDTARECSGKWRKTVVLKGAYTIIAAPDGRCRISQFSNPGLASAGTGDVLAGTIAGLLAQGLTYFEAASLGVYLHAKAGEIVRDRLGDTGMIATDLLPEIPVVIKRIKDSQ